MYKVARSKAGGYQRKAHIYDVMNDRGHWRARCSEYCATCTEMDLPAIVAIARLGMLCRKCQRSLEKELGYKLAEREIRSVLAF